MNDCGLPIVVEDSGVSTQAYVDWEGVDFLADTRDMPIKIKCGAPGDQKTYVETHTRTTFRSALITSLLETDALNKSQAFQQWLKSQSQF